MSDNNDDIKKSNAIKPKVGGIGNISSTKEKLNTYDPTANIQRKSNNVDELDRGSIGPNFRTKTYSTKVGQLSAKEQAAAECSKKRVKELSGPVKGKDSFTPEQIKAMEEKYAKKSEDELLDEEADGKQEIIEGKEPLKKDPVSRWKNLKKALDHNKAFMALEEEMEPEEDEQATAAQPGAEQGDATAAPGGDDSAAPEGGGEDEEQSEGGDEPPTEDPEQPADEADPVTSEGADQPSESGDRGQLEAVSPEETNSQNDEGPSDDSEAVSEGDEDDPEAGNGDVQPDPQELIDALKEEGYSDAEIAYIVHGHHAPEVDPSKAAKAQATSAMSDLDLANAAQMAELEREHSKRTMDHDHEHKRRMADLEYQGAQKKQNVSDIDEKHRQRMLDLEYQHAQKQKDMELQQAMQQKEMEMQNVKASAPDAESDKATKRELQQVEIAKKKLELKLHEEEMKLELEFRKREHELKLRLMELQMKEQAKQKQEISGIKHEQRVAEAKNPPAQPKKPAKKAMKKSEDADE